MSSPRGFMQEGAVSGRVQQEGARGHPLVWWEQEEGPGGAACVPHEQDRWVLDE